MKDIQGQELAVGDRGIKEVSWYDLVHECDDYCDCYYQESGQTQRVGLTTDEASKV